MIFGPCPKGQWQWRCIWIAWDVVIVSVEQSVRGSHVQGVPKKGDFQNAVGATVHPLNHQYPSHPDSDELLSANDFFGRFLVRLLSKIKRSQVMSIGHFGPPALNFGYDFWALATFWSHFFWNTLHRLQKKVQGEFSLLANVALYSKECYQPYQSLTFAT